MLLASQRIVPRALGARQFVFDFPTLDAALADIVGGASVTISPAQSRPEGAGAARYELRARTVIDAPLAETFAFFSKAANLGLITPAAMAFSIQGQEPPMGQGARIDYHVRVGGLPVRWRTLITRWEPGRRFVDLQEAGPYRVWWHEHWFEADGERTVMEDRVYYAPPLGFLGRLAHRFFIGRTLRKIFQYPRRRDSIEIWSLSAIFSGGSGCWSATFPGFAQSPSRGGLRVRCLHSVRPAGVPVQINRFVIRS